jgi:nucleoside-diphosphate-sugar epimerase
VSEPRILVTGSGGFIGRHVVGRLEGMAEVRAARTGPRAPAPDEVACDLFDPTSLARALDGVEVVVHCAREDDAERMAEGVRRLLDASLKAGVRRFIQLSSVAVYGSATGVVTEDTPPQGVLDAYARSKLRSEDDCRQTASESMTVAVMRPALVYGPGSAWWTTPFVRRLTSGKWKGLGDGGLGRANLVHVEDVARFAAFLAIRDTGAFALFNADGPETPTWNDYLDRFADALGAPRPQGRQSTSLALARLRRALKPVLGDDLAPTYQELLLFRRAATYATGNAAKAGFTPLVSLEEGLAGCAAWARARGLA